VHRARYVRDENHTSSPETPAPKSLAEWRSADPERFGPRNKVCLTVSAPRWPLVCRLADTAWAGTPAAVAASTVPQSAGPPRVHIPLFSSHQRPGPCWPLGAVDCDAIPRFGTVSPSGKCIVPLGCTLPSVLDDTGGGHACSRLWVRRMPSGIVLLELVPLRSIRITRLLCSIGTSDPHKSISASLLSRLAVGCTASDAGLWVSLVAMSSSCPTRTCLRPRVDSPALTSDGRGSCCLRAVKRPRPVPTSVFRGSFHSRSASAVALSPRRLSWLRINRPVTRPTASLDTERGVSAYSGGFLPLDLIPLPGRNLTIREIWPVFQPLTDE
jgi:hypothetical protein